MDVLRQFKECGYFTSQLYHLLTKKKLVDPSEEVNIYAIFKTYLTILPKFSCTSMKDTSPQLDTSGKTETRILCNFHVGKGRDCVFMFPMEITLVFFFNVT